MPHLGMPPSPPPPRVVRGGAFTWDTRADRVAADRGRLYARGGIPGEPDLGAVCAACVEGRINAGDRRGGWSDRPLRPGEDVGCWLCGRAVA